MLNILLSKSLKLKAGRQIVLTDQTVLCQSMQRKLHQEELSMCILTLVKLVYKVL